MKVVEKIKNTHFTFNNFFFFENRAICDVMSKNMVETDRPQMATWPRFAGWISKTTRAQTQDQARAPTHPPSPTHTPEICKTFIFHGKKWLHERASILCYMYIACLGLPFTLSWLRDSVVGIAACYWLQCPAIECQCRWPCGLRVGLQPLDCWDSGFKSRRGHGCLCCVYLTVRTKGKIQDNPEKKVRIKYRERTNIKYRQVRFFPRPSELNPETHPASPG